jgi:hypothetical protein
MAWLIQRAGPLRPGLFPASAASRDPTCAQKGSEATETGDRHDRLQDRFPLSPRTSLNALHHDQLTTPAARRLLMAWTLWAPTRSACNSMMTCLYWLARAIFDGSGNLSRIGMHETPRRGFVK